MMSPAIAELRAPSRVACSDSLADSLGLKSILPRNPRRVVERHHFPNVLEQTNLHQVCNYLKRFTTEGGSQSAYGHRIGNRHPGALGRLIPQTSCCLLGRRGGPPADAGCVLGTL